jgi:hypothetical protein
MKDHIIDISQLPSATGYNCVVDQVDLMLMALGTKCTSEQAGVVMEFVKENLPIDYWASVALQLDYICPEADCYYHVSENMAERGYY